MLGHVLERAANKPLDRLLQEMLCDPLQLESTAIEGDAKLHPATGYALKSRSNAEKTHLLKERLASSGGLVTTTEDLAKFLTAQRKLVTKDGYEKVAPYTGVRWENEQRSGIRQNPL